MGLDVVATTVPLLMNYQGYLTDAAGRSLSGYYTMTVRLYDDVAAPITATLWSETHVSVAVRSGRFGLPLGSVTPLPEDLFSTPDRYLGVTVHPHAEMVPRQRLASVPYAFRADVPAGTVVAFVGTDVPDGWLPCDGSPVSRSLYPALFSAISTAWGSGDGSTTFNLPDLRGRGPIGAGQGAGLTNRTLAQIGGEEAHTLTVDQMPAHRHSVTSVVWEGPGGWSGGGWASDPLAVDTTSVGGSQPHNTMQPFAVVNFIIKY
jgi:microcystin-dependent protein